MNKKMLVYAVIFFGTAIFLFFWQRYHWDTAVLHIKGQRVEVLVAENLHQQYRGLGKRDSIAPYDGMLFPHALLGRHGIVMRDMRFAIDIVWLKNTEVVDIAENAHPESGRSEAELTRYYPRADANLILELPAGWVTEHDLSIGDKITIIEY